MRYVLGFIFSPDLSSIALLRKQKPDWQRGKLNGIGGKIEADETPHLAMQRECLEEAGFESSAWSHFATLAGQNDGGEGPFSCDVFAMCGKLDSLKSMEAEQVEVIQIAEINANRADMVENLPWLIYLTIDHLADGRPRFVYADYP